MKKNQAKSLLMAKPDIIIANVIAEASVPEAASEPARAVKPARRRPPRKKAAAPDSAAE